MGVGGSSAHVDMSASDALDDLDFGARGFYRYQAGRWALQVDVIYNSLTGKEAESPAGARVAVDLDQAMIGVDARYQLQQVLELIIGARYWDYDVAIFGPEPGAAAQPTSAGQEWVDPLIGARVTIPLGSNWEVVGRGDIGGFGVGSDSSWHATAFFDWKATDQFSVLFGYRAFDVDFEDGSGAGRFALDIRQSGPAIGMSLSF
jgi:hypothetical protein